ncbi:MAG: general secretion pathway protein GspB [Planctomycetaceae bacterium]|nr:general secretion pathway protein GspB [Planctomycetaceae bacterium]
MSLINDALKRAEYEKARGAAAAGTPLPRCPSPRPSPRHMSLAAKIALVIFFLGGAALLAPLAAFHRPVAEAPLVLATAPQTHAAMPPAAPSKHPLSTQAQSAQQKTLAGLKTYLPSPATQPAAATQVSPLPACPPAVSTASAADSVAAKRTAPVPAPPAPPTRPATASFKLSGVMCGPSGPAAIINGHALQAGDRIDGATVVRIDQQSVLLNIDGQTVLVRL